MNSKASQMLSGLLQDDRVTGTAMDITPIKTKKRYVLVIDKILELIRKGSFKHGDRLLPERLPRDCSPAVVLRGL